MVPFEIVSAKDVEELKKQAINTTANALYIDRIGTNTNNMEALNYAALLFQAESALWAVVRAQRSIATASPLPGSQQTTPLIYQLPPFTPVQVPNPQIRQLITTIQIAISDVVSKNEAAITAARRYQGAINAGNPSCSGNQQLKQLTLASTTTDTSCATLRQQEVINFVDQSEQSASQAAAALHQLSQLASTIPIPKSELISAWAGVISSGHMPVLEQPYFDVFGFSSGDLTSVVNDYSSFDAPARLTETSLPQVLDELANAIKQKGIVEIRTELGSIVPGIDIQLDASAPTLPEWAAVILGAMLLGMCLRTQHKREHRRVVEP